MSAPFVSTLATFGLVNSLNKNAFELFCTSKVTLNKSFAFTSLDGNAPEHTFSTSVVASRLIAMAFTPVTLL